MTASGTVARFPRTGKVLDGMLDLTSLVHFADLASVLPVGIFHRAASVFAFLPHNFIKRMTAGGTAARFPRTGKVLDGMLDLTSLVHFAGLASVLPGGIFHRAASVSAFLPHNFILRASAINSNVAMGNRFNAEIPRCPDRIVENKIKGGKHENR